jgi:hypothetical protein
MSALLGAGLGAGAGLGSTLFSEEEDPDYVNRALTGALGGGAIGGGIGMFRNQLDQVQKPTPAEQTVIDETEKNPPPDPTTEESLFPDARTGALVGGGMLGGELAARGTGKAKNVISDAAGDALTKGTKQPWEVLGLKGKGYSQLRAEYFANPKDFMSRHGLDSRLGLRGQEVLRDYMHGQLPKDVMKYVNQHGIPADHNIGVRVDKQTGQRSMVIHPNTARYKHQLTPGQLLNMEGQVRSEQRQARREARAAKPKGFIRKAGPAGIGGILGYLADSWLTDKNLQEQIQAEQ